MAIEDLQELFLIVPHRYQCLLKRLLVFITHEYCLSLSEGEVREEGQHFFLCRSFRNAQKNDLLA